MSPPAAISSPTCALVEPYSTEKVLMVMDMGTLSFAVSIDGPDETAR